MKKTEQILNRQERAVERILRHRLPAASYRVFPSVRLSDVIKREPGEYLPRDVFNIVRGAHFDFVIAGPGVTEPIFAVEFDGPLHDEPEQIARDIIKNRLCRDADLPLLRIRASDTNEHDRVSLLDFMLDRYVAWEREHEGIGKEIAEYVDGLCPEDRERLIEDEYEPWADSSFRFDLRHPFPGTKLVRDRLLREHTIAAGRHEAKERGTSLFLERNLGRSGNDVNEEFHRSESHVAVYRVTDPSRPVFRTTGAASVRSWLKCQPTHPTAADVFRNPALLEERFHTMWFPHLPGIWAWDIAEHFSEYLAMRAVEDWAKKGRV